MGIGRRVVRTGLVVLAAAALVPASTGARASAAAPDACALVTVDEANGVIGAAESTVSAPLVARPGTCSWHADEVGCTLRILSLEVTRGGAARTLAALRAETDVWSNAAGIGDDGIYTADVLPPGSAVFIEHLHLRRGDTLATVTLLGRISPATSHELLARVGGTVAARL